MMQIMIRGMSQEGCVAEMSRLTLISSEKRTNPNDKRVLATNEAIRARVLAVQHYRSLYKWYIGLP